MTLDHYLHAQKKALKLTHALQAKGEDTTLPVLSEIVPELNRLTQVPLGLIQIPLNLIEGTATRGRTTAFARNFMPLLDSGSDICIASLEQQIKEQENDLMRLVRITAERGSKDGFENEFKRVSDNIKDLKHLLEIERTKVRPAQDIDNRLNSLFEKIDEASSNIEDFNNQIIRQLIAQIRVDSEDKMTIILASGYRFEAKLTIKEVEIA